MLHTALTLAAIIGGGLALGAVVCWIDARRNGGKA